MRTLWPEVFKAMLGVFVFISTTLLWFWVIYDWTVGKSMLAIIYTVAALVFYDKLMVKQWQDR